MIEAKKEDVKIKKYEKWKYCERSTPLQYLCSMYHPVPLCHGDNKMVMNEKENKTNHQFQVGYMLNPGLNTNREFREQVEINLDLVFSSKTMIPIRIVLRKENTRVLSPMMFHENKKNIIFKVFISVVYFIIKYYVCSDYLCFHQTKLNVSNKVFEKQHEMLF